MKIVAGVDEAGMGALAGPVVAAAVVLKSTPTSQPTPSPSLVREGDKVHEGLNFLGYYKVLTLQARENRKNPTKAEQAMWSIIGRKSLSEFKFSRQKPLLQFVADFYCSQLLLVVEVDGDVHSVQRDFDEARTEELSKHKIQVLRFTNREVLDSPDEVESKLSKYLSRRLRMLGYPPDKGGEGGLELIRDSKKLSPKQREKAAIWISENASSWAIAEASVEEIAQHNIRAASHLAMQRAVKALDKKPQLLLIDGNPLKLNLDIPIQNVVKGDDKHIEIAAASILAKVHRDAIMQRLDRKHPGYGFAQHKGYGTGSHLLALKQQGASEVHRAEYAPVRAVA